MSGWYVVNLLMCGINGVLLGSQGYTPSDWQWWVWCVIPIVTYIAGREVERSNK